MKKYRIRPNSIAGFVVRNKKGLTMIAAASIILAGMSAATLAFAADESTINQPKSVEVSAEKFDVSTMNQPISAAEVCEESNTQPVSLGEFRITHYCACEICCGSWANNRPNGIVYTASGAVAEAGKTIAVDPDVIPYGTEVVIDNQTYIAQDCGSAIQDNRIDVYCDSHQEALQLGVKYAEVFLKEGEADV